MYPQVHRHMFKLGNMAAMVPARKCIFPAFHDVYHSQLTHWNMNYNDELQYFAPLIGMR